MAKFYIRCGEVEDIVSAQNVHAGIVGMLDRSPGNKRLSTMCIVSQIGMFRDTRHKDGPYMAHDMVLISTRRAVRIHFERIERKWRRK